MSGTSLTLTLPDEKLNRLRERFPGLDAAAVLEKLVDDCLSRDARKAREEGWRALSSLIGLVHGDGTSGADEHDRWGLGTDE